MAGGLMQLVAYGAQDVYLTGNPNITFFKVIYRRHTNFAAESIEQYFQGTTNFGKKSSCEISRNGDLITTVLAKIITPEVRYGGEFAQYGHVEFAWVRKLGHAIILETELEIGGSQIDKQYGEWLNIWYELTHEVGKEVGYAKMIGDIPLLTSVSKLSWDCPDNNLLKPSYAMFVPLQFYFNRNNGLALPLIALQYHQVKIYMRFRPAEQCYIASEAFQRGAENFELEDASLYVNYIYLDTEERRRFAQVSHEYLIEQLQDQEESIGNSATGNYKLNFNHPCKSLYFVVKLGNYLGGKFMVYEPYDWQLALQTAAESLLLAQYDLDDFGYFNPVPVSNPGESYTENGIEYVAIDPASPLEEPKYTFNDSATAEKFDGGLLIGRLSPECPLLKRNKCEDLKDKVEGVIKIYTDFDNKDLIYPEVQEITRNDLKILDLSIPIDKFDDDNRVPYIRCFDVTVWQHHNYGLLIDGTINPVTEVLLKLNGQDRQSRRAGFWYDTVEPYLYFVDTPVDGINVYSFGLNPVEHQPSGTCNFSRIDTATLNLWFAEFGNNKYADVFTDSDNTVRIFTVNYNVLRILSGMGGLAYSN